MVRQKEFPNQKMKSEMRVFIRRGSAQRRKQIRIRFRFRTEGNVESLIQCRQEYIQWIRLCVGELNRKYEFKELKFDAFTGWLVIILEQQDPAISDSAA